MVNKIVFLAVAILAAVVATGTIATMAMQAHAACNVFVTQSGHLGHIVKETGNCGTGPGSQDHIHVEH